MTLADARLPRILIADDEAPARARLRDLLDDCRAEFPLVLVDEARNGREVLEIAGREKVDIVLLDIRMPQMDGCEMSRRIRALDRSDAQTVPIIAMTADAFEESVREAKAAGINGYVTKPIVPNLLYKALVNALKSD